MTIDNIRICGMDRPLGFRLSPLTVSWNVRHAKGKTQNFVHIRVSKEEPMGEVLFEKSGRDLVSAGERLDLVPDPCTKYFVQVTVQTDAGEECSEITWFETGKRNLPWLAQWIGTEDNEAAPEFRKTFVLEQPAAEVAKARLYISGLGLFEAQLNGEKIGEDFLAPFTSDYRDHVQVCTYNVTNLVQNQNDLQVFLGNGWYKGRFGLNGTAHPELPYGLLAELVVTFADGSSQTVCTDSTWNVRPSAFVKTDIYDGETQDWLQYKQHAQPWKPSVLLKSPPNTEDRMSLPLTVMETLPVREVLHTKKGETVLDFGQNFAGFVRLNTVVPEGQTLKMEFGELLQGGNFYHENYRTAVSEFEYISDGEKRIAEPHFTYFGFRYVKVSGSFPGTLDTETLRTSFTGCVVYSKMERTGFLSTGHETVNRLVENTLWGMKSNFFDLPTDCPQRDERLGWCGDAMVFSNTAGYHMNTKVFYAKFLQDLRTDQQKNDGRVAIYLPNEFSGLYAGVWSDIGTFLPKMVYDYYGDKALLREHYPLMKDWVDFVHREDRAHHDGTNTFLYDFGFQFGDWLALDGATEQSRFGRTDSGYVASMYYYASTRYVAESAKTLGLPDAPDYYERADCIKAAILAEYFTQNGRLAIDTQTGYLLALKFGVYKDKQRILDGLNTRMKQDCYRIKGGFVGATMMNTVLADNGLTDLAYDFLFFEGFPGWLNEVNLGATTIWERWNSVLSDGTISGVSMNSMNHYAYGSVVEFLYRHAMGLQPTSPGFRTVRIAPQPDIRLGHLEGSYDSAFGTYVSNWTIEVDGSLTFHIEVPFGCAAEVCLPEQSAFTVPAGSYDYTVQTKRNYRSLYKVTTRFETLLKDERAVAILNECMPGFADSIDRTDKEAMSRSLENELVQAALFRKPDEHIRKAIEGITAIVA